MNKAVRLIILLYFIQILSCYSGNGFAGNIYFAGPHSKPRIWYDNTMIDFSYLDHEIENNGFSKDYTFCYDSKKDVMWIASRADDSRFYRFYRVDNNIVNVNKPIVKENKVRRYLCFINDSRILFCESVSNNIYVIKDLSNSHMLSLQIPVPRSLLMPVGFADQKIFFDSGYYSIEDEVFNEYQCNLEYVINSSAGDKIIGLGEDNQIIIHDLRTSENIETGIYRKLMSYIKYTPADLYFLDGDNLYFSKDIGMNPLRKFFLFWYSNRKWYCNNLSTCERNGLSTPHKQLIILGVDSNKQRVNRQ